MSKTYLYAGNTVMQGSPAMINPTNGQIVLNRDTWGGIPENQKPYILAHEEGHYVLQTPDEFEADLYAYKKCVQQTGSRKAVMAAITEQLNSNNIKHRERALVMLLHCLKDDFIETGNPESKANFEKFLDIYKNYKSGLYKNYAKGFDVAMTPVAQRLAGNEHDEFYGLFGIAIGKKAKERKAIKQERKQVKKDARLQYKIARWDLKNDAKAARIDNVRSKADSRVLLAQQGIATPSPVAESLKAASPIIGAIAGAVSGGGLGSALGAVGQDNYEAQTNYTAASNPYYQDYGQQYSAEELAALMGQGGEMVAPKKNNTLLYAGIALAILAVLAILMMKGKKKKAK